MYTSSQTSLVNPNLQTEIQGDLQINLMSSITCKSSLDQGQGPHLFQSEGFRCLLWWKNIRLHHNIFKERQFNFCRIKESVMPSWKALFRKRPKGSSNCNGLEGLHPQVRNLHSSQAVYGGQQLPPTAPRMHKLTVCVPTHLGTNMYTQHDKPVLWTASADKPRTEVVYKIN